MSQASHPEIPGLTYQKDLGVGGFADVYLYRRDTPDRLVAIKVLRTTSLDDAQIGRLKDEANAMAALNHPNIAQVYSAGITADNRPFIEMAYYPYGTLDDKLQRAPLSVPDVMKIGVQLCAAIQTAHNLQPPLLHRDIKPSNVLIDEDQDPMLTDFGISSRIGDNADDTGLSVFWAPPEVMFTTAPIDERSDIYSLAALLWNLLAGYPPYFVVDGDNSVDAVVERTRDLPLPGIGRADVPASLEGLLGRALSKDPALRPATATEFADALNDIEQQEFGFVRGTPFVVAADSGSPSRDLTDHTEFNNDAIPNDEQQSNSASAAIIPVVPAEPDGVVGASPINTVQPAKPRNKLKVALIVVAAVIALALIVLGTIKFLPHVNPAAASSAAENNPAATPDGAVQEFLQAVAGGDASTALNLLTPFAGDATPAESTIASPAESPTESSSTTPAESPDQFYLTNEVLAKSNELAPITNIVVAPPDTKDSNTTIVAASYDIGSQHVDTTYNVTLIDDSYRVNGTIPVDFSSAYAPRLNMTLNGVSMDRSGSNLISLFPGTYQLSIDSAIVAISNAAFVATGPADPVPTVAPSFKLTEQAPAILGGFAKKTFDDCLAETNLGNSCGWGAESLPEGATFKEGSNVWVILSGSDDFTTADWQIGHSPTEASATIKVTILSTCSDTSGQEWHSSGPMSLVQIDFKDPDKMTVWFY